MQDQPRRGIKGADLVDPERNNTRRTEAQGSAVLMKAVELMARGRPGPKRTKPRAIQSPGIPGTSAPITHPYSHLQEEVLERMRALGMERARLAHCNACQQLHPQHAQVQEGNGGLQGRWHRMGFS